MELIKKIKEAESQGKRIIENAGAQAAKEANESREKQAAAMAQAQQERKKTLEAAISSGEAEAAAEVEKLRGLAGQQRQELRQRTESKKAAAVKKVTDYIRG